MKLPNAEAAIVPQAKIEDYLLDLSHPVGGGKARFFVHFGFRREAWNDLADALQQHARENAVADSISDADGVTHLIEGPPATPSGRKPHVRSVWLVETGVLAPRFITTYPLPA